MDVRLPDGTVISNVPDGISKAELVSKLSANGYDTSWYKQEVPAPSAPSLSGDLDKFRKAQSDRQQKNLGETMNVLAGLTSVPRGALNLVSEGLGETVFPTQFIDKESGGYTAGQMLDPAAWAVGGGAMKAAQAIPKIGNVLKGAIGGAAGGGAVGATQGDGEGGAVIGGAIGGGIPAIGLAISKLSPTAKNLFNSISATFSKGGRTSVGQKMVLDQLQPAEKDAVLKILQQKGVDVSDLGSDLTVSQSLGKARLGQEVQSPAGARVAALEKELATMPGGEGLNQRYAEQSGLRSSMMDTLSGGRGGVGNPLAGKSADDLARDAMIGQRSATAQKTYPTGEVTGDPRLNEIMSRPGVKSAMGIDETSAGNVPRVTQIGKDIPARTEYKNVFTEWQQTPYKENLPEVFAKYPIKSLQNQYRLMDKQITTLMKTGLPIDESRAIELMSAKKDLGSWLESASPEWAQANRIFASQSVPVRQMEVGAALKEKMAQSPSAFIKSVENVPAQEQLIRSTTGRPGMSFEDVFNLGQRSKIAGLKNEAQIGEEVKKLQSMVKPDLADEKAFQLPNLLNVWVAVLNKVSRQATSATVDDVTRAAAELVKNPAEMRKILMKDAAERAKVGKVPMWGKGAGVYAAPVSGLMSGEPQ